MRGEGRHSGSKARAQAHGGFVVQMSPRRRVRGSAAPSNEFARRGLMGSGRTNSTAPRTQYVSGRGQLAGKGTGEDALSSPSREGGGTPAAQKVRHKREIGYRQKYQYCEGGLLKNGADS